MGDHQAVDASAAPAVDAEASVLMKRGIQLLATADGASEALACFDAALELRLRLPIEDAPAYRYGLAACWVNRADALARLGDPARLNDALHAYESAIAVARELPMHEDPRFPRRLAIAHQNRGLALLASGRPAADAIAAFTEAIAVLDHEQSALIADRAFMLAAVCVNLANAQAGQATDESEAMARETAQRAIDLAAGLENEDPAAAEVGLKARHVLCRAVARRLAPTTEGDVMADDLHAATDAVDDGLDLISRWEDKGITAFRGLARDLFRFGALVYATYQPQFLDEFVRDHGSVAESAPPAPSPG